MLQNVLRESAIKVAEYVYRGRIGQPSVDVGFIDASGSSRVLPEGDDLQDLGLNEPEDEILSEDQACGSEAVWVGYLSLLDVAILSGSAQMAKTHSAQGVPQRYRFHARHFCNPSRRRRNIGGGRCGGRSQ